MSNMVELNSYSFLSIATLLMTSEFVMVLVFDITDIISIIRKAMTPILVAIVNNPPMRVL